MNVPLRARMDLVHVALLSFRAALQDGAVRCGAGRCVALSRYISVCHPFRREKFCTTRRACVVIASLFCGVLALHVVQAYFWQFSGIEPVASPGCGVRGGA